MAGDTTSTDPPRGVTGLPPGVTQTDNDWVARFSNFTTAWTRTPRQGGKSQGEGIVVVHPDTGYTNHPELLDGDRYSVGLARNFLWKLGPSTGQDDLRGGFSRFPGHGTSTASVLLSGIGPPSHASFPSYSQANAVTGVAPKATVIPCRVTRSVMLNDESDSALARAIWYALGLDRSRGDVGVISVSLGRTKIGGIENKIKHALRDARKGGVVVCAAAGQLSPLLQLVSGMLKPGFPSSDPDTICAAACDADRAMLVEGFYGAAVDITAPGAGVWVARSKPSGDGGTPDFVVEGDGRGTSHATAVTAGACALWQAHHGRANLLSTYTPRLIVPLFREVLKRSCHTPAGWDTDRHGPGVLDADALLEQELPSKSEIQSLSEDT